MEIEVDVKGKHFIHLVETVLVVQQSIFTFWKDRITTFISLIQN